MNLTFDTMSARRIFFSRNGQIRGSGDSVPQRVHKRSSDGGLGQSPQKSTPVLKIMLKTKHFTVITNALNQFTTFPGGIGSGASAPLPMPEGAHV